MSDDVKKLHRSADDRWLAGVCGGIAEYFNVDSTLVRVLFVLFGFAVGGGILIYIILWIIMPEAPDAAAKADLFMEDTAEAEAEEVTEAEPEEAADVEPEDEAK
ncbi:MAG: PspC domain-containing protein [Anaerolineaceae bacterium]|jgi:phage shock protein PspC (stress-responsive transcriptional regulator)|nr:PspC domain-containing protein [Chloroflexota bacterium]UCC54920.1 MAG: PspC domain-containing protein [Anaerolineaceae bacterium]